MRGVGAQGVRPPLVHRDLTSSNILLGADGRAMIAVCPLPSVFTAMELRKPSGSLWLAVCCAGYFSARMLYAGVSTAPALPRAA